LRKAEIERLDWNEVKLDRKLIDLPFWKSKNKKRKLIQVPDNLLSILGPFVKGEGNVKPKRRFEVQIRKLKDTLKMKWPQNVLRHSFCSYSVAIKGLAWTAEQANHSETILKRDYWEVVSPEDAARYWTIVP
jgi:integrase